MTPKALQVSALNCLRKARECPDLFAKEALRERAAEFARSAFELDSLVVTKTSYSHPKHRSRARRVQAPRRSRS
jgi:hypothetical protein